MSYKPISDIADETKELIDDYQLGRRMPLFTSSANERDLITGIYPGDLLTIAAASGIGKTFRLLRLLLDFCNSKVNPLMYNKIDIFFDTWEMADTGILLRILASQMLISAKGFLKKGSLTPAQYADLDAAIRKIKKLPMKMDQIPKDVNQYIDQVEEQSELSAHNGRLAIFCMDHTRMGKALVSEKTEERMITGFLQSQVTLKKRHKSIFIDLSQMNRNYELRSVQGDLGRYMPIKSDIFGSDTVYQCSDLVVVLHRPGYYGISDWEGQTTGIIHGDPNSRDDLWVEGWLKQREGDTDNLFMRHQLEHLIFKDI